VSGDNREAILARLQIVLSGVDGIKECTRNKTDFSSSALPAIGLMEGIEEVDADDLSDGAALRPMRVTMTPQLVLWVSGKPEEIGTTFNTLRQKVIKATLSDAELVALTTNGRRARYAGTKGPMIIGELVFSQMLIDLRFGYVLKPNAL
jgi:hypothetical protein